MFVVTISNSSWLADRFRSSAEITLLISSGFILSAYLIRMCAWGNPRIWHSTEYIQQRVGPNTCNFVIKLIKNLHFCLNTRAAMLWRCIVFWPGNSKDVISCHFGLHVNVKNKIGHSRILYVFLYMTWTDGRMIELPISAVWALLMSLTSEWILLHAAFVDCVVGIAVVCSLPLRT